MKKLNRLQLKIFFSGAEIYHCKSDNGKTVTAVVRDSMSVIKQIVSDT